MFPLLDVKNLTCVFWTLRRGWVPAIEDVSFSIEPGESVALVGESGCGKSVTALSIMGLIPSPQGRIIGDQVLLDGEDLLKKSKHEMRHLRGKQLSMIFQQPMTALNPVYSIGFQLMEAIRAHEDVPEEEARKRAIDMLNSVGISEPERRLKSFPHQLSGGMKQRVMIAMALMHKPRLLIADEPTTALDVTIQAQILDLMRSLTRESGTAILLITHDLGVVAEMCRRVVIMYAGKIVEEGPVKDIFLSPLHPYAEGLLKSIPKMTAEKRKLHVIPGVVPSIENFPPGCRFHPRCAKASARCSREVPEMVSVGERRRVRCWNYV